MNIKRLQSTLNLSFRKPKLYLFSAHDTTIVPLLVAFKIFDNKWPVYCANIAIELWQKDSGDHIVKILYCGEVSVIHEWNSEPLLMTYGLASSSWLKQAFQLERVGKFSCLVTTSKFHAYCSEQPGASTYFIIS